MGLRGVAPFPYVVLLLVWGALYLAPLPAYGQAEETSQEVETRLTEIASAAQRESEALQAYEQEATRLSKEKAALEREIGALREAQRELAEQERLSLAELKSLREDQERTLLRDQELRVLTKKRLRAMYQFQPRQVNTALVSALMASGGKKEVPEMLSPPQANYLLAHLRTKDQQLLAQLAHALSEQERRALALDQQKSHLAEVQDQKSKKLTALRSQSAKLQTLLARASQRKAEAEARVLSLQAEALKLEQVLVTIMGGVSPQSMRASLGRAPSPPESRSLDEDSGGLKLKEEPAPRSPPSAMEIDRRPFEGPGLRAQRKQLTPPVRGTVVRGFGKQRHKEFSDLVFQRGIEVSVRKDLTVRAVAEGRVLFVGTLPGYGMVVLIDHGQRSHSLYGRLGPTEVLKGTEVERGQVIATLEPADRRGSNFYFEVRENSAPVNPRVFFPNL